MTLIFKYSTNSAAVVRANHLRDTLIRNQLDLAKKKKKKEKKETNLE